MKKLVSLIMLEECQVVCNVKLTYMLYMKELENMKK